MSVDMDNLAQRWREAGDPHFRLEPSALASLLLTRAETHLSRITRESVWECIGWGAFVLVMGGLLGSQRSVYALLCHVYAVVMLAISAREFLAARALDVAQPVALVQQRLEGLRILRILRLKWGVLGGTVLWAPFAIVLWQALTGIRPSGGGIWMAVNIGLGMVLAAVVLWLSRWCFPAQRVWRALSGESLAEAERALDRLREFRG